MVSAVSATGSAYRHINRFRHVISIMVKYGFGYVLDRLRLWEVMNIEKKLFPRRKGQFSHFSMAQRFRYALEELGPTFIKLGQLLSTRPDIIPAEYIAEFQYLQNRVTPVSAKIIREVIEKELGSPIEEIFTEFDDTPVAAASLSQVHRAVLPGDEEAAVKVQRPGIADTIRVDLEILQTLSSLAERYIEEIRVLHPKKLVKQFAGNLRRELNFRSEATNMRRTEYNFRSEAYFHVPAVHHRLCTGKVLIMEYIDGVSLADTCSLVEEGYDTDFIARKGAEIALRSVLEFGFFHADPHPGNLFILPGNVICFLDYGMMGSLTANDRASMALLIYNIVNQNEKGIVRAILELSENNGVVNLRELETDIATFIEQYAYLSLEDLQLGEAVPELFRLLRSHKLVFRPHFIWLIKMMVTIEMSARQLVPDFNIVEFAKPYAERMLRRQFRLRGQIKELRLTAMDLLSFGRDLPYEARDIMNMIKAGRIKLDFDYSGFEPIRKTFNRIYNRMALALILSALLIGSSIIVMAGLPPLVRDIPVIGLGGFVFSALIGIWLIISIFRSGSV